MDAVLGLRSKDGELSILLNSPNVHLELKLFELLFNRHISGIFPISFEEFQVQSAIGKDFAQIFILSYFEVHGSSNIVNLLIDNNFADDGRLMLPHWLRYF